MRLPGLDLLRALAIVWVMLFHSWVVGGLGPHWSWLSRYGWMGVDLFFVLSGYLIGRQVLAPLARGQRLSFVDFYLRRALRILPAFWVVLAVYACWPGLGEGGRLAPVWMFLSFTVNLLIDYGQDAAFSHAWSLCVEEHFYLVFPLLAAWLVPRRARWTCVALCVLIVVGGMALRAAIWLHDARLDPGMEARNWFIEDLYFPTWARLDGLLAGVLLAMLQVFRPAAWARLRRHANRVLVAGVAGLALAMWLFRDRTGLVGNTLGWPLLSAALALLVFAGAGADSWIGRRALPGAAWLAGLSYSLYLVHKMAYHLVQGQWGQALAGHGVLAFCGYGLGALLAGAFLHYAVEAPCLRLRGRLLARWAPEHARGRTG